MGKLSLGVLVLLGVFYTFISRADDTYALAKYNPQKDSQDFLHLKNVIEQTDLAAPEDFLAEWKKLKPEYFSNYVLGYRSRSLQKSSASHPRALMFNKNADLVISFNGNNEHKGFNNLELMHFNHDSKTFEFFEMSFLKGKAQLSDPNPKKCLACHQSLSRTNTDPRPNWEPYNTWLGFYGSLDDSTDLFKNSFIRDFKLDPVLDEVLINEIKNETQWLKDFRQEHQSTHPRYGLLSGSTTNQYGQEQATLNGDLTNRLAVLNFKRVARLISSTPPDVYRFAKWAIWSHAQCGMTLYVKEDVYKWLYEQVPNQDYARIPKRTLHIPAPTTHSLMGGEINSPVPYIPVVPMYKTVHATDMINILFESVGISTEDWSMDFKTDGARFAAFERFGLTNDPRPAWVEAIKHELSKDSELANTTCEDAKTKTIAQFSDLKKVKTQVQALRAQNLATPLPALIDRCTNCHNSAIRSRREDTPTIPFDDPEELKIILQKTGYKRGTLLNEIRFRMGPHATEEEQMPKGGVPTSQQKEDLLNYLETL